MVTRAADDFRVIRARVEELRWERTRRMAADDERRRADGKRSYEKSYDELSTDNKATTELPPGRFSR